MITIEPLKNHMQHIPTLVEIWRDVLGSVWIPEVTSAEVASWMRSWEHVDQMPTAHIALDGDKAVGVCSLQKNDGIRPDLYPWLCDLSVKKNYQNQKIGQRLIDITKEKAHQFGFRELYLFAFDPTLSNYYRRLGWRVIGFDTHRNLPVTVMATDL